MRTCSTRARRRTRHGAAVAAGERIVARTRCSRAGGCATVAARERIVARTRAGWTCWGLRCLRRSCRRSDGGLRCRHRRGGRFCDRFYGGRGRSSGGPSGRGQSLISRRFRRRGLLRRSLLGGLLGGALLACRSISAIGRGRLSWEDFFQLSYDWRLNGRRCRPDELSHVLELGQNDLALDSELFRELVHPDLSHCSPVLWSELHLTGGADR
jgi:hypothetical protein